jgi:transcription elongation GreA/GreB family factor
MSRAFVKESDQEDGDTIPERPVSPHANFVTPTGLHQIEAQIRALDAERTSARAADDKPALARVARDLRYWNQRRATAQLIEPGSAAPDFVRFGTQVTIGFQDGTNRTFRIVGEDEADPNRGLLSWVSPVASGLIGRAVGDSAKLPAGEAEILRIEP